MSEKHVVQLRVVRVELELRALVQTAAKHVTHQHHRAASLKRAGRQ